jgi:hypothetical protein
MSVTATTAPPSTTRPAPVCTFVTEDGWSCPAPSDCRYRRGFRQVHRGPLCARHYVQLKTAAVVRCREAGCTGEAFHQGRCRRHEHLPLLQLTEAQRDQLRADFLSVITADPDTGCWLFNQRTPDGYGRFRVKGAGVWLIHRLSWHLFYGPHENGRADNPIQLDHRCQRPACCNPLHLRPTTQSANLKLRELRADPAWDWRAEVSHSPRPLGLVLFCLRNGLPMDPSDHYSAV